MTKIDIFSGFLGAGKTTLIKKLIREAFQGEKLMLIENEFGEIGIDGGFMQDVGIQVTEMNSGCICCSLVGDFGEALKKVLREYAPDRILIEPSGVGKLSDVIKAVQNIHSGEIVLNSFTTIVDANKCRMYMKNFGEFFNNQIEHANSIVLSRTDALPEDKLEACVALLREHNNTATIITTPWDRLSGTQILAAMEHKNTLGAELELLAREQEAEDDTCCGHHDHGHEHVHQHEHEHCEHEHAHQHEHEHCDHEHDHDHEHHDHEHHHHADEVFVSWGVETPQKFTEEEIQNILAELGKSETYGTVLRAKGIVEGETQWLHFDFVPGEQDVRTGSAAVTGRLCVIGAKLNESALKKLFRVA